MSEQFPICAVRRPSFGGVWAIQVRSWCSSRSSTCENREAGGSSLRPILSERPARTLTSERVHRWRRQFSRPDEPQHRDKLLARGEEPQPGSHVISPRRGYVHHGIYIGDGKVVHYAGLARGRFRGRIEEVSLAEFAYGRSVWTRSSNLPAFVPGDVIRRARSRVGENRYRILRNNCEHFCEWCLRGESRSYQVERFLCSRPALGMMLGVISLVVGNHSRSEHTRSPEGFTGWRQSGAAT
jgi:Lecithin retinol acyltransferase